MKKGLIALLEKYPDVIHEIDDESAWDDGYWIYFKPGYLFDRDTHLVHEYTIKELARSMRNVSACDCDDCKKGLAK